MPVQDASDGAAAVGVGGRWPVATLESHDGGRIDFTALDGPVVVCLYHKGGTPTCTREAVEFKREYGELAARPDEALDAATELGG